MAIGSVIIYLATTSVLTFGDGHSVTITADNGIYDVTQNVTIWSGDVEVREGPYVLHASSLEVRRNQKLVSYMLAKGKPVNISGPHEGETAMLEGEVVIYDQEQQQVSSHANAKLHTSQQSIGADKLLYHLQDRILEASGNDRQKVKLRFEPKPVEG